MPVERSEPAVPGFRDYARNDEVEDPTLCGEYRDVTLRAPLPYGAHIPVMLPLLLLLLYLCNRFVDSSPYLTFRPFPREAALDSKRFLTGFNFCIKCLRNDFI